MPRAGGRARRVGSAPREPAARSASASAVNTAALCSYYHPEAERSFHRKIFGSSYYKNKTSQSHLSKLRQIAKPVRCVISVGKLQVNPEESV